MFIQATNALLATGHLGFASAAGAAVDFEWRHTTLQQR
jgi:hypothetical protein